MSFLVVELPDAVPLANATIEVCRNAVCSGGRTPDRTEMSMPLQGDLNARVGLWRSANGVALDVNLPPVGAYPYGLADGDVYRAVVKAADQSTLYSVIFDATYAESCPNGPDCDPCPCITGNLVLR